MTFYQSKSIVSINAQNNTEHNLRDLINIVGKCSTDFCQIHFPCENEELDKIHNKWLTEFNRIVESSKENDDVQRIKTDLMNQLDQHLKSSRKRNKEECRRLLFKTSKEMITIYDRAIRYIRFPCSRGVFQNIKTEMMNRFDDIVGVAIRHHEAQNCRDSFESQIDQRVKKAILENNLKMVKIDTTFESIAAIEAITLPCKDVESSLEQIRQKTMNDLSKRLNDVVDENPQKMSIRSELNKTVDRHFRAVRARNDVISLENLGRVVEGFMANLRNKSFFTRVQTIIAEFQTRLRSLVVSRSCNQWIVDLESAANLIQEQEARNLYESIAEGLVANFREVIVAGVRGGPSGVVTALNEAGQIHSLKVLAIINDHIQTTLTEAQNELNEARREITVAQKESTETLRTIEEAHRELSMALKEMTATLKESIEAQRELDGEQKESGEEVQLPNSINRKRRLSNDSTNSERHSKSRALEK